jgi:choline dehydrogenase
MPHTSRGLLDDQRASARRGQARASQPHRAPGQPLRGHRIAGGNNRRLEVKAPAAFPKQFHSKIDWDYWTEPEPHLNGRRVFSPLAKVMGGCSEMNAMIYIRGNRYDYDSWADEGAQGWSYDDVLGVFKRSECNDEFDDEYHGTSGPLKVTRITDIDPVSVALIDAAPRRKSLATTTSTVRR